VVVVLFVVITEEIMVVVAAGHAAQQARGEGARGGRGGARLFIYINIYNICKHIVYRYAPEARVIPKLSKL